MISKKKKKKKKVFAEIFQPKSEIQRFFPPKIRWSPKKKKKKKVFAEIQSDFSSKISQLQTFQGGALFVWGGYFPFFTENRPQKHKNHAILQTSQANGGARAPPAPPWLRYWSHIFLQILIKCKVKVTLLKFVLQYIDISELLYFV